MEQLLSRVSGSKPGTCREGSEPRTTRTRKRCTSSTDAHAHIHARTYMYMPYIQTHAPTRLREVEVRLTAGDAVLLAQREHPRPGDAAQLVPRAGRPHLAPAAAGGNARDTALDRAQAAPRPRKCTMHGGVKVQVRALKITQPATAISKAPLARLATLRACHSRLTCAR